MPIDFNNILSEFVSVAQNTVGSQLSTTGPAGNLEPSVIKVRQNGPKPATPYITCDVLSVTDSGAWILADYVEDNGDLVYESNKSLLIQYRVYGGNAIQIANDLHGYFRVNSILSSIVNNTGGAVVIVDDVVSLPQLLSDTFLESASININFQITDTLVITDSGENYFTQVDADGVLHNGATDPPPLDINILAP